LSLTKGDYILTKSEIVKRLEEIYSQIPEFECRHCHKCCGPIVWFKPEEILIRDFMKDNNLEYIVWSTRQFEDNSMLCPYIKNDRCVIYPVRPIVCRLQGTVLDMLCKHNVKNVMSKGELYKIKMEFEKLLEETEGKSVFYGTRKYGTKS